MAPELMRKVEAMVAQAQALGYRREEVLERAKRAVLRAEAEAQRELVARAQRVAQ